MNVHHRRQPWRPASISLAASTDLAWETGMGGGNVHISTHIKEHGIAGIFVRFQNLRVTPEQQALGLDEQEDAPLLWALCHG